MEVYPQVFVAVGILEEVALVVVLQMEHPVVLKVQLVEEGQW